MFRTLSVRWRLAGAFFAIILALVLLVSMYLLHWTERNYVRIVSDALRRESNAVAQSIDIVPADELPGLITKLGQELGHRITIIKSDGVVMFDSVRDFHTMQNHSDRPEVRQALVSGYGSSTRYSSTIKTDMLYVATTHKLIGSEDVVVRVAEPLSGLKPVSSTIQTTFILAGLAALILAGFLSFKLASGITAPIEEISSAARRLAHGDLTARSPAPREPQEEMGALALTFNQMADRLQSTIREINEQKARMQTIFDRTDDGLILIGPKGDVQMINPAACGMLGIESNDVIGRSIIEGTLSHDLSELLERVTRTKEPASLEIALPTTSESAIYALVTPITGAGDDTGALIVLHDVTESRRLDAMRRDFVANVSHELRTPLASIKAMAETILLQHANDPAAAPQFAERIVIEADRMTFLAEDLLDLAKIESGHQTTSLRSTDICQLVDDVFGRMHSSAEAKSIELVSEVADAVSVKADYDSVVQIMMNLIDNAVKYTPDGGRIIVSAQRNGGRIDIQVSDNGIGIPQSDLPRIFERFYRVDKARSRQSGGTGLGLSIVKHLSELMGGTVSVTSESGKGTTFTVALPADENLHAT